MRCLLRIGACRKGLAALEFALLFPVMLVLFCSVVEMGNFLTVGRKIAQAAQNCADLITQEKSIDNAKFDDVTQAIRLVMEPYPSTTLAFRVTSVVYNVPTGAASVAWQKNVGTIPAGGPAPTVSATGLGLAGESVVLVNLSYQYTPLFSNIVPSSFTVSEFAVARPRRVRVIPCTATGC